MLQISLLAVGVLTMLCRPARLPVWGGPVLAAAALLATGGLGWHGVHHTATQLRDPLLFLVFAVPLAVLLDGLGFFASVAASVDGHDHLHAKFWVLTTLVVIVFNLDAAVVLLTPLAIRIARRNGLDPVVLAFAPALLACLASGLLPVSNLTNLLAVSALHLGLADFVLHLGLPTAVAVGVGWWRYRAVLVEPEQAGRRAVEVEPAPMPAPNHPDGLRWGVPVVAFVILGFTVGERVGVSPWVVAAVAVAVLLVPTRRLPWRSVPYQPIVLTFALALLVAGAVPHLGIHHLLAGRGTRSRLEAIGFGSLGAAASNNLPVTLAGLPSLGSRDQVWGLLLGANMGPVLVLTASLSSLLWRDTAARLGVTVSARRFSEVGVRVGLPALLAAAGTLLAVQAWA